MDSSSKKRVLMRALVTAFTILALTGIGILAQVFVRESSDVRQNRSWIKNLEKEIRITEGDAGKLQEEKNTLKSQVKQLKSEKKELENAQQEEVYETETGEDDWDDGAESGEDDWDDGTESGDAEWYDSEQE